MNNDTLAAGPGLLGFGTVRLRVLSVIAAVALVFAVFALVQAPAEAAPTAGVTASIAGASVSGGDTAQLNFNQIICAALLQIRAAFANSPFFAFVVAAINPLLIAFGCVPSG